MRYILFIVVFLFLGCSHKYYEPQKDKLSKPIHITKSIKYPIKAFNKEVATLSNGQILSTYTILPKNFVAIDKQLSKNGTILRVDGENINFDSIIVTAAKKDNLIAIVFGDNHFELYDMQLQKSIYSKKFEAFLATRKFIAKPIFYKDLLIIPTLDGKIKIFDLTKNDIIQTIVISQKDYFNNIIYLGIKDDNLIIASRDRIMVIAPSLNSSKNYNIAHILVDDYIYLFTIEGDIKKLDFSLKELDSKSFKYAHIIFPMIYNDNIYFIIRSDKSFLVKIDKELNTKTITPILVYVDDDKCYKQRAIYLKKNIFGMDGIYYIGDNILKVR
jgi:hypothetical protein